MPGFVCLQHAGFSLHMSLVLNGSAVSNIDAIRNIGIIAHIDAGKTTTTERILYYAGASHRMGNVDDGTTVTDFDEEEAQRGITIYSAAISCEWDGHAINIIDTPGHVDFTAEVERSLRVLDGGVVVFSAVEGVEAQSETVWRQADRYQVPRICFINKMDRIGADFERTFDQIIDRLKGSPVALQIPIGSGSPPDPNAFRAIIDLVQMKTLTWGRDDQGATITSSEIDGEHRLVAEEWRARLMDKVVELDDDLMAAYLADEPIPAEKLYPLIRKATVHGQLQPTLCGSSLDYIGVQPVLDAVTRFLPSPLDMPPVKGPHPNPKKEGQVRKPDSSDPLCGLAFKVQADQHGDFCFFRIYSGVIKTGMRVLNPRTGQKELVNQLWKIQADSRAKLDEASAGDIVGIVGFKDVVTGDTLCDPQRPILLENIAFPETVISMAVEPESSAERKKLAETLARLSKQDPTFTARVSEETGQTIISGMGELHLEVIAKRMAKDFNLKVRVHKPRVSYRESIRKKVTAEGEFTRKSGEESQYAKVTVQVEPFVGEKNLTIVNQLRHDAVPQAVRKQLEESVLNELQAGGIVGYPLMNVKLTILDIGYREIESTELALTAACAEAVRNALTDAGVVLLEPVMKLEVVSPEDFLGNVQSDLNTRRAIIVNSERRGHLAVLDSEAPLSEMFGYSTQVRSLSQGRASYSMEPLKYAEAPLEVLKEMLGE